MFRVLNTVETRLTPIIGCSRTGYETSLKLISAREVNNFDPLIPTAANYIGSSPNIGSTRGLIKIYLTAAYQSKLG